MTRRLLLGLLAVAVFALTAYGAQLVTRQPVARSVAQVDPGPVPVPLPLPTVAVDVQNFPVDDEGNLRVTEHGNNETPKNVAVVNLPAQQQVAGEVGVTNLPMDANGNLRVAEQGRQGRLPIRWRDGTAVLWGSGSARDVTGLLQPVPWFPCLVQRGIPIYGKPP